MKTSFLLLLTLMLLPTAFLKAPKSPLHESTPTSSLHESTIKESETCGVCQETISSGQAKAKWFSCPTFKHTLHRNCAITWLESHGADKECPLCQAKLLPKLNEFAGVYLRQTKELKATQKRLKTAEKNLATASSIEAQLNAQIAELNNHNTALQNRLENFLQEARERRKLAGWPRVR